MRLRIVSISHHTNGVVGESFDSALFYENDRDVLMHASVFQMRGHVAVHQVSMLADADVGRQNHWGGDQLEDALRDAIHAHIHQESLDMAASD